MFTIKHETPGGDELHEAETFECRSLGNTLKGFSVINAGREPTIWLGRLLPPCAGSSSECRIYVMNRDGATVASYRYEPTQEDTPGDTCAAVSADMSLAA